MEIIFLYNHETDTIKLIPDSPSLHQELIKELEDIKEILNTDLEISAIIDEKAKTIVCKSRRTNNTFRGNLKELDAAEICHCLLITADMDDAIEYIEIFNSGKK